jgi:methionyl-tRNA formyltransferase
VILRDNVLTAAPAINIHPSLLPKYRGPAPMLTAILNGDFETGVCLMDMAPEVDAGDIHMVRRLEIGENNTVADLESRVSVLSADMLSEYLKNPDAYPPMPQVGEPTFTRKFNAADMEIDWNKTPLEIHNQVRSIGGRTKINGIDVKILETRLKPPLVAASGDTPPAKGGRHDTEFQSDSVQCAPPERGGCPRSGLGGASIVPRNLEILRVQPAGKKPMDWKSFVNGLRGAEVKLGV